MIGGRAARGIIMVAALATILGIAPARAQDDPAPDPAAVALLVSAASFGDGWLSVQTTGLELDGATFRGGALGVYTGPAGARILAAVMLTSADRVVVRRSWEEAVDLFRKYSGELEYEDNRDDHLAGLAPPPGCVEAKRIDGSARQLGLDTGIPMGLTLCAADPDLIVLIVVSGPLRDLAGFTASDAVASLMLGAIDALPAATPAAS